MNIQFKPKQGLIVVNAEIEGPTGKAILRLALDTGATSTVIHAGMLVALGYDPATTSERHQITTGSGIEFVPKISLTRIKCLGIEKKKFLVLSHTMPSSTSVDGVLGLDFLREKILIINFQEGIINLS